MPTSPRRARRRGIPCLSLWERWPSAARTERVNHDHLILLFKKGCKALSVTCGDSSPKGRAKGLHRLPAVYALYAWADRVVRPYNRLPSVGSFFLCHSEERSDVGIRPPAAARNTAQRCHSEPVTDVTGVGIRPRARRRGNLCLPL